MKAFSIASEWNPNKLLRNKIAPFAYNRGVEDAKSFFMAKAEDLGGICFEESLTHRNDSSGSNQIRWKLGA